MVENKIYKPSYLALLNYIIPFGIFFIYGLSSISSAIIFGIFLFFIGGIIVFFGFLSIYFTSYELRQDGFFIKRGVIAKSQTLLLYSQIQDVTEYKTFINTILGLKRLHLETMTATSAVAGNLAFLSNSDADELKKELLRLVHSNVKSSKNQPGKVIEYNEEKETKEENVNPYPLHFTTQGFIFAAVFFCMALIADIICLFVYPPAAIFVSLIFGGLIALILISMLIQQATFKYWLGDSSITIKSGLFNTQKTVIQYSKLQDYIKSQGIFDRIFGYSSIHFETGARPVIAGNNGGENQQRPNYILSALKLEDANTISEFIMKKLGLNFKPSENSLVNRYPLSNKKLAKKIISGTISQIIAILILSSIFYFILMEYNPLVYILIVGLALFALMFIWNVIYQSLYFNRYYYDVSKDTLTIRKGAIGWNQNYLPFDKIQNIFMDQDLLDRIFGIYDVHVSTVGFSSERLCHIDGLTKENAEAVRNTLSKLVKDNL